PLPLASTLFPCPTLVRSYALAVTIAEVPLLLTAAARNVMFAADSSEPDAARLATTARLVTALCLLAALGMAALLPWAIPVVFGRSEEHTSELQSRENLVC